MKVVEKIFEHRIRQQTEVDDMQFGFRKGKGTNNAIFMARQMQENFRVKGSCSCSLGVLDPRVGHTMGVLSPFIPVLCHSD